jgi:tRNA dimethylallyltransferase
LNKKVLIVVGPTAAGKTSYAIDLAKQYDTEIISADSRQCFKELNIGVARPSPAELEAVPHHFIASHSIHQNITAADFEEYALACVNALLQQKDVVVMVGGTGLYIKAFCEGLDDIPEIDATTREQIMLQYKSEGLHWLQATLQKEDPDFFATGEIFNPRRLMRALEVKRQTGSSILQFRKGMNKHRDFDIEKIGLEMPREMLYERINQRVDDMMQAGLLEEVKSLLPYQHLNALQTVGYRELFDHLAGLTSLPQAIDLIKQNTRRYAKRQMTWFKKDLSIQWLNPPGKKG